MNISCSWKTGVQCAYLRFLMYKDTFFDNFINKNRATYWIDKRIINGVLKGLIG